MNAKHCRKCERFSFSSVDEGEWNCPTCQADLSKLPHVPAGMVSTSAGRRKALSLYQQGGVVNAVRRHDARA